jgi:hypothetical protein
MRPRNSRLGPSTRRTQLLRLSWAGWSRRRRLRPLGPCFCWCSWGTVCPWGSRPVCAAARGCLFGLGGSQPRLTSRRALSGPSAPVYADARVVCLASAHLGLTPHRDRLCPSVLAGGPAPLAAATARRYLPVQLPGWFIWPRCASASALIAAGPAPSFGRAGQSSQRRLPRPYPPGPRLDPGSPSSVGFQ